MNKEEFAPRSKYEESLAEEHRASKEKGWKGGPKNCRHQLEKKIILRKEAREQGLKYYFTGKECIHGHIDFRYTKAKLCCKCADIKAKKYAENNPEKRREISKNWKKNNPDKVKERSKKTYLRIRRTEEFRERQRKYQNKKYQEDKQYAISKRIRARIRKAIKRQNKSPKTQDLLGCSWSELRKHLESQFHDGMSWENFSEWDIDHIIPISAWDLEDEIQLKKACHFSNLKPLWRKLNQQKSDHLNINHEIVLARKLRGEMSGLIN